MSNRGYRRRPRKRITGRFYAFLTVVVVVAVFVGVLISGRGGGTPPPAGVVAPVPQNTPVIINAGQPTVQPAATQPVVSAPPQAADATLVPASDDPGAGAYDEDEDDVPQVISEEDMAVVSSLSVKQGLPSEWRNILLLGTDTRNLNKVERTDTIMIASVNVNSGKVKLASIMRDLVVPYTNKSGSTKEVKINSLIGRGGADLVMKTVNELFGMNITEYVMVDFSSFQEVVDILGGVDMDVTAEEMEQINKDLGKMAEMAGMSQADYLAQKDSLALKTYGAQTHLTGIQALGYARIRHVGQGDYRRTERQREMLDAILRKVKKEINVIQVVQMATSMWGKFRTNMDFGGAVSLATAVMKGGSVKLDASWRIPGTSTSFTSEKRSSLGSALYDCDFQANADLLYKFVYES